MNSKPRVAIVGATGMVGRAFLTVLEEERFPAGEYALFASARLRRFHPAISGQGVCGPGAQ